MNKNSVYNLPGMYSHPYEAPDRPLPTEPVFAVHPGETILHTFTKFNPTPLEALSPVLDPMDIAVVEEIGRSKFLTSLQIHQLITLRGFSVQRARLHRKLLRLMRYRLIQENKLVRDGSDNGLMYYELDLNGWQCARKNRVVFHMGNRYMSYCQKIAGNCVDTPFEVKRVLAGNQIVIGMLINRARIQRFGIMETFCVEDQDDIQGGSIFRTAANVKIDDGSILAYEVVRDTPEGETRITDKVARYYKLVGNRNYLERNHHSDSAFPQLVICGESLEHNRKLVRLLKEQGLWRSEDPILFTEDLLNIRDSLNSLYEIRNDGTLSWYRIPSREPEFRLVACSA